MLEDFYTMLTIDNIILFLLSTALGLSGLCFWKRRAQVERQQWQLEVASRIAKMGFLEYDLVRKVFILSAELRKALDTGRTDEDLSLDEFRTRILPEDRERVLSDLEDVVSGKVNDNEAVYRFLALNNKVIYLRSVLSAVKDSRGMVTRLYGTTMDVTSLMEAEEKRQKAHLALQDSEIRFQMLYDNIPDPAFLIKCETKKIVNSNLAAQTLYGYTAEEFQELTVSDLSCEQESTIQAFGNMYYSRIPKRVQKKKNGEEILVEIQQSIFEQNGEKYVVANLRDITERENVQEVLNKNLKRLVEAQEMSKSGHWELDLETGRLWCSEETYRIFEIEPEEGGWVYQETLLDNFVDPDRAREAIELMIRGKRLSDKTYKISTSKSKTVKTIRMLAHFEKDLSKNESRLVGVVQDISEQVEKEQELRQSKAILTKALNAGKMGYWQYDQATCRFSFSDSILDLCGMEHDEFDTLETFVSRVYPEDRGLFVKWLRDEKTPTQSFVCRFNLNDGRVMEGMILSAMVHDDFGNLIGRMGIIQDVTERRNMERHLQEDARREAFLSRCLHSMLKTKRVEETIDQIVAESGDYFDAHKVVVFEGDAEHDESELSYCWQRDGVPVLNRRHKVSNQPIKKWLEKLKHGPIAIFNPEEVSSDEMKKRMEAEGVQAVLGAPIWIHHKMWGRIAVVYNDDSRTLTDRDAQLLGSLAGIISLGVERSQKEATLLDERNRAEAANRAKSDFLANMSHEIRTPMTAILGFADLLSDAEDEEQRAESIQTIRKNGRFLLQVINDILDFSKIEANRIELEKQEISFPKFLAEIESLVSVTAFEKGLGFKVECDTLIPKTIVTDPLRLKQVMINLLGNAIKFTEKGYVSIGARVIKTGDGPRLEIRVSDTGVGISEKNMKHLFEPFTQADSSVTRRFGGTGLGLTISARLVEMLGGSISVSSSENVGTIFYFTIDPVRMGKLIDYSRVTTADSSDMVIDWNTRRLEGTNILLVEDGLDNQRLISLVLRKAGGRVSLAQNGQEACEMVSQTDRDGNPYDIILMDMQMPVMDGYTATRKIREKGNMPILALTAHAMAHDRKRCIDAGCNGYIPKPIQVSELLEQISEHLKLKPYAIEA